MGYAALMNGIPEGLHRMVLPHYLVKVLRSALSGQNKIFHSLLLTSGITIKSETLRYVSFAQGQFD
jgi:hypothetical protein